MWEQNRGQSEDVFTCNEVKAFITETIDQAILLERSRIKEKIEASRLDGI